MSGLIIILGSALGFFAGVVSYFATDIGLFYALAIWAASGPLSLILLTLGTALGALASTARTEPAPKGQFSYSP